MYDARQHIRTPFPIASTRTCLCLKLLPLSNILRPSLPFRHHVTEKKGASATEGREGRGSIDIFRADSARLDPAERGVAAPQPEPLLYPGAKVDSFFPGLKGNPLLSFDKGKTRG